MDDLTRRRLQGVVDVARARLAGNLSSLTWELIFDAEAVLRGEKAPNTGLYADDLIRLIGADNATA